MNILSGINISFAIPLVFCLLINLPYLNPEVMIGHDTKSCFITFHYFFNHLAWHGEIPRWMPYGGYGYSSLWYQVINFSPSTYLVGGIGWLLKARDTMMLFKLSIVVDQLVFLVGLHLLSKRLFKCRYTRVALCIAGVGSVIWYWQVYWNLRLFYVIPLILYLYHRFLVDRIPWAFWAALLVMLMNMLGGVPYWAPVYLLLFLIMNAVLLPRYWRVFSCLGRPGWKGACLMALFAFGAVSLVTVYATCMDGLQNYSSGRSPETMDTDLQTFLTYTPPLWGLLHSFLDGIRPDPSFNTLRPDDLRLYVGLFSVAGFFTAIVHARSRWFYALLAVVVATVLLAGSGLTSWILYWIFPGMDKFRHLALMMELAKICILLAAGYGMEIIFRKLADTEWLKQHFRLPIFLILLALLVFIVDMVVADNVHDNIWISPMEIERLLPKGGAWIVSRVVVWAGFLALVFLLPRRRDLLSAAQNRTLLAGALLMVSLFDLYSFQMNRWSNRPVASHVIKPAFEAMQFTDKRRLGNTPNFQSVEEALFTHDGDVFESFFTNVYQDAVCLPLGRVDLFSKGVHELLSARGLPMTLADNNFSLITLDDGPLRKVLGCETSKLRIVPQGVFIKSDEELGYYIRHNPALDATVLLQGTPATAMPSPAREAIPANYVVKSFSANHLDVEVDVESGQAGWLVYADSYSPYWQATVNGVKVPLYEAYMAFKAVWVKEGRNRVVFEYRNGVQHYAMNCLLFMGILFSGTCILIAVRCSFNGWQK